MILLPTLHAAGLAVSERDGRLVVGPRERLTDELRQAIRAGKAALLLEVREQTERELLDTQEAELAYQMSRVPAEQCGVTPGQWAAAIEFAEAWNTPRPGQKLYVLRQGNRKQTIRAPK